MNGPPRAKGLPLVQVLGQAEQIKESIEEAAGDLASVNEVLKQNEVAAGASAAIDAAVVQNEEAEQKVAKAGDDLEQVNAELAHEVTARVAVESRLADLKVDLAEARADLSESRAEVAQVRQAALQDPLTELPNRALFEERLEHGLVQARRHGWGVAVLFIDLDEFKWINDSHGHDLGDEVLLTVARRLREMVRGEDLVSRWGGDEFACVLLDVRAEADAVRVARSMVRRIAETCTIDDVVLVIRASIGIALFPADGDTAETLFQKADRAMYEAKRSERGVVLSRET